MKIEELEKLLEEKIGSALTPALEPVIKEMKDRVDALEKIQTKELHTPDNIIDDGVMQEVGTGLFRLPGGSVVNVGKSWSPTAGGFARRRGVFESVGEETKEYFAHMKEDLKRTKSFEAVTKALDISDVMRSTEDAGGGMFVPEDVRYALLQFAPPGTVVWPRAQVWPMNTQSIQWPKLVQDLTSGQEEFFGNVVMTWTEEGTDKEETRPNFTTLGLDCHEISAYTEVTDVLIEDSAINIGNLLVQLFQGTYWHHTDAQFLRGMGNTRPLGVLNDPKINVVSRVTASKIRYEDLINMDTALPPMFDAGAIWLMSKACFNSLRKQKDSVGHPVIQLGEGYNNFGEGIAGYILGKPVVMSDYKTSALGSRGDVVLGDWKHYFIGERSGIKMEMSRHVAFRQNRTAFRTAARLGGIPEEAKAFVVLDSTVDASLS